MIIMRMGGNQPVRMKIRGSDQIGEQALESEIAVAAVGQIEIDGNRDAVFQNEIEPGLTEKRDGRLSGEEGRSPYRHNGVLLRVNTRCFCG